MNLNFQRGVNCLRHTWPFQFLVQRLPSTAWKIAGAMWSKQLWRRIFCGFSLSPGEVTSMDINKGREGATEVNSPDFSSKHSRLHLCGFCLVTTTPATLCNSTMGCHGDGCNVTAQQSSASVHSLGIKTGDWGLFKFLHLLPIKEVSLTYGKQVLQAIGS